MISAAPAPREAGGTGKSAEVDDRLEPPAIFKSDVAAGFGENPALSPWFLAQLSCVLTIEMRRGCLYHMQEAVYHRLTDATNPVAPLVLQQGQGAGRPGAANP
jgi:hypothetical protein